MSRSYAALGAILVLATALNACLQAPGALPGLTAADGGSDAVGPPDSADLGRETPDLTAAEDGSTEIADTGDARRDAAELDAADADSPPVRWQQVAVGQDFACGLTVDGVAYCWGSEADGRLGSEFASAELTGMSTTPLRVGGAEQRWTAITTGRSHACAIGTDRSAYCWGDNAKGGVDPTQSLGRKRRPLALSFAGSVELLAAGDGHTCAIDADNGDVLCWGNNDAGQAGVDPTSFPIAPGSTILGGENVNVVALSLGNRISCLQDMDGTISCWGSSISSRAIHGQAASCGDACDDTIIAPRVAVDGDLLKSLSLGFDHACAVNDDGFTPAALCWGENLDPLNPSAGTTGKLGDTASEEVRSPNKVASFGGAYVESTSAGWTHSCAISSTEPGALWCWGDHSDGALGVGTAVMDDTHQATRVAGSWSVVSAGAYATCGIQLDGSLWCWGRNTSGQLGVGDTVNRDVPTRVDVR